MMPKHSLRAPWGRHLTAFAAVSLLTLGACSSDDDGGVGPSTIEVVEIVTLPNNQSLTNLVPGTTRQMLGVPTNSKGNFIDKAVTWASSNPAAVTVTAGGEITAVAGGSSYIRATAGGQTDSIQVTVRYPVGTVTVSPATATLRREAAQQLTVTTLDTQGATVTGRTIAWSSNVAEVTVSSSGLVSVGPAVPNATVVTISATAANASDGGTAVVGSSTITVNGDAVVSTVTITGGTGPDAIGFRGNSGSNNTLVATAKSGLGNTIVTPMAWTSSNPAIATVDAGTGAVTFVGGTGNVTITATATGAGNGGADVSGTAAFAVEQEITSAADVTIPSEAADADKFWAYNMTAGHDSVVVAMTGGTGDADIYLYRPGSPSINFYSFNSGNEESILLFSGRANQAGSQTGYIGWWRVNVNYWIASGGATLSVREYP